MPSPYPRHGILSLEDHVDKRCHVTDKGLAGRLEGYLVQIAQESVRQTDTDPNFDYLLLWVLILHPLTALQEFVFKNALKAL